MGDGVFTITELPAPGSDPPGGAARFEWTAAKRSAPRKPWSLGTTVRSKRTDYDGGDHATEQVLGPSSKPQQFTGRWDDRFNGAGYARATMKAFDAMVRRGNPVRIEFRGMAFVGLIKDAEYPYDDDVEIGYRFELSVHRDELAAPLRFDGAASRPLSASQLAGRVATIAQAAREAHAGAPVAALAGTVHEDVSADLAAVDAAQAELDGALNQRIVLPREEPRQALLRMIQLFTQIRSACASALNRLIDLRSDVELGYRTAIAVVQFDGWVKDLSAQFRLLALASSDAAAELAERADAPARALYQPQAGEHLYGISQRFYGTPHQWRAIANRNGLTAQVCTGDELLIIPEAGQ